MPDLMFAALTATLIGGTLGLRFPVLAIIPAILTTALAATIGTIVTRSLLSTIGTFVAVCVCLQLGFLATAAVKSFTRETGKRPSPNPTLGRASSG